MIWQPIETAPERERLLFWLEWADDVAPLNIGHDIGNDHLFIGLSRIWCSLYKATHWQRPGRPA